MRKRECDTLSYRCSEYVKCWHDGNIYYFQRNTSTRIVQYSTYLFMYVSFLVRRYWPRANKNRFKKYKFPLVARPFKDDSRRNRIE